MERPERERSPTLFGQNLQHCDFTQFYSTNRRFIIEIQLRPDCHRLHVSVDELDHLSPTIIPDDTDHHPLFSKISQIRKIQLHSLVDEWLNNTSIDEHHEPQINEENGDLPNDCTIQNAADNLIDMCTIVDIDLSDDESSDQSTSSQEEAHQEIEITLDEEINSQSSSGDDHEANDGHGGEMLPLQEYFKKKQNRYYDESLTEPIFQRFSGDNLLSDRALSKITRIPKSTILYWRQKFHADPKWRPSPDNYKKN